MEFWYIIGTLAFVVVAAAMVLIILVQRPSGGGLAGAFGGSGGGGTDSVFGGRVGDALTVATVAAFVVYLALAITLNLASPTGVPEVTPAAGLSGTDDGSGTGDPIVSPESTDDAEGGPTFSLPDDGSTLEEADPLTEFTDEQLDGLDENNLPKEDGEQP